MNLPHTRGYKSHIPEPDEPDPCGNCWMVHDPRRRCDPADVRHAHAVIARKFIRESNR